MTSPAPIAIFIYNRPEHLRRTLTFLKACGGFAGSPVYVFGDGPKGGEPRETIEKARGVAREMLGEGAVYAFADANKGLARSIIDGVGSLTEKYGKVIVVEDDLVLAPDFLTFMNEALLRYEGEDAVHQVSGHMFDVPEIARADAAVMLPFTTTWGWATWKRAWKHFDPLATGWEQLGTNPALRRKFNLDGAYDYAAMMERQMSGRVNSWGIRWYWSVFRQHGLVLYPPLSMVGNTGFDGAGTHGRALFRRVAKAFDAQPLGRVSFPEPKADPQAYKLVRKAVIRQNGGLVGKAADRLKKWLRR